MECLTLGSLFDGIGGWQLAAIHSGVTPVWSSEIDSFPASVTAYHFPKTAQLGDITKVDGAKITPVDIICAGSPCQNLSQAGNRKGLNGENSSLFLDATRIFHEMRNATNGKYPRFFVWENVTGAFSSNHGNDFRAVLEEIGQTKIPMPQSGRWGGCGVVRVPLCDIAWRTLDAQYWGVPQRRRRIFLVADFAAEGRCAAEILFVESGMPGDTAASEVARKGTAEGTVGSACTAGRVARTLTARMDGSPCIDRGPNLVYSIAGNTINRKLGNGGNGKGYQERISYTLDTMDRHVVAIGNGQAHNIEMSPVCGALNCMHDQQAVYDMTHAEEVLRPMKDDCCNTLNARMGTGGNQVPVLHEKNKKTVRRLTPTECERLQGLPDGWTDVPMNGKPASDSRRYKAIGNGMAQPCADFVMKQIAKYAGKERKQAPEKLADEIIDAMEKAKTVK